MTFKVGDMVEFDYMAEKLQRVVRSIGDDGTLYVDIDEDGSLSWAVHPGTARQAGDPPEAEEGNTEEVNNFRMGPPEESSEEEPTQKTKYIDLDTYAKIATVIIFGGLILGHM